MTETLTDVLTACWGSDPKIRVVPCFADGWHDVADAKAQLRHLIGDADIGFRVEAFPEGVDLLRELERRCATWLGADLFADGPKSRVLVVGWMLV